MSEFTSVILQLTDHQWKLLEVVIQHAGKWLTRRQIAKAIGRRRLIPYDIDCLRELQELQLVEIQKVDDHTPIGYQVVYRSSERTNEAVRRLNLEALTSARTHDGLN